MIQTMLAGFMELVFGLSSLIRMHRNPTSMQGAPELSLARFDNWMSAK